MLSRKADCEVQLSSGQGAANHGLRVQTFSQVFHIHDLALRDPAHIASKVFLQLLLLPELLEGPPGLGLLSLLGEFPGINRGGRKGEE